MWNAMKMSEPSATRLERGVTIVELLVSITIIGSLLALVFPAVNQAREAARSVMCQNQLRQIGIAFHSYVATFGVFPPNRNTPWTGGCP
jgi:prepilin-type N-terminal cleavage/methylation domain-containing protein